MDRLSPVRMIVLILSFLLYWPHAITGDAAEQISSTSIESHTVCASSMAVTACQHPTMVPLAMALRPRDVALFAQKLRYLGSEPCSKDDLPMGNIDKGEVASQASVCSRAYCVAYECAAVDKRLQRLGMPSLRGGSCSSAPTKTKCCHSLFVRPPLTGPQRRYVYTKLRDAEAFAASSPARSWSTVLASVPPSRIGHVLSHE